MRVPAVGYSFSAMASKHERQTPGGVLYILGKVAFKKSGFKSSAKTAASQEMSPRQPFMYLGKERPKDVAFCFAICGFHANRIFYEPRLPSIVS